MTVLSIVPANGPSDIVLRSLAQLSQGAEWRLDLLHDRPEHLFIWVTRGQGLALIDGVRRGLGAHNALFIPAGTTMAIEMGRQGYGQTLSIPVATGLRLPAEAHHLRIRDVAAQSELTAVFEALQREQTTPRPLHFESMAAQATLLSIWLRRQLGLDEHAPGRLSAGARLSRAFCQRVSRHYQSGAPMAQYAKELGVTATHLTRTCRASTGKTAADLLTQRILYEARHLLTSGKVPVQDIARHLRFGSAAYFTRFIQHHTGNAPTALRKQGDNRPVIRLAGQR